MMKRTKILILSFYPHSKFLSREYVKRWGVWNGIRQMFGAANTHDYICLGATIEGQSGGIDLTVGLGY
jgi:hypothetical protein